MRPPEPRAPRALPPLSRDDRLWIRHCAEKGDTPRMISAWTGRPEPEVKQVIEERRHG